MQMFFFRYLTVGLAVCVLALAAGSCAPKENKMAYLDTGLPFADRTADLVSRMTLPEKISQMGHSAPAVDRLGIPSYNWWNEGLHGVARNGIATVFPQAIGLAAAWDADLHFRLATVISDEGRAKHNEAMRHGDHRIYTGLTFWSPNINIFRDPRWGRGMETYGEDPFLTARLGVQFVKGLQGDDPKYLKTVATPKHYAVHSGPEPERHSFDAVVGDRDFLETYLPAFHACIVEGGAWSIMGAYNRFRGHPCCASPTLLVDILRNEWQFKGYVVSDCWAIRDFYQGHNVVTNAAEAAALAVRTGCDLNCGDAYQEALAEAVEKGLLTEAEIDTAVKHLFLARFNLGMFDPDSMVPYAQIPESVNDSPAHRELALEAAHKSIVLLKNAGGILPLDCNKYKKVAVLGPQAVSLDCLLGNYNGHPSAYTTVLDGIRAKLPPETEVTYLTGCDIAENFENWEMVPPASFLPAEGWNGKLKVEHFAGEAISGEPVAVSDVPFIGFQTHRFHWPIVPQLEGQVHSARISGKVQVPVAGRYKLRLSCGNKFTLSLDGVALAQSDTTAWTEKSAEVEFEAGSVHALQLEMTGIKGDANVLLEWSLPIQAEVAPVIKQADLIVLCLGLSPNLEGEEMPVEVPGFSGGDRTSLDLPATQEALLKKAVASGKPVVLVLMNGSALSINSADKSVPAIVEAWYPGEEGGKAVSDVLFGDYNPGGRLPVTFYKSVDQLPSFEDYNMQGRTYRYFKGEPLYPFGFGLSYTTFEYGELSLPAEITSGDSVKVAVTVKNTGSRAGDEVVQVYLSDLEASVPVPQRALVGFKRVSLAPGESARCEFSLAPDAFTIINDNGVRVTEPGAFEITVGGKQPGFKGSADAATTTTVTGQLTLR